MHFASWRKYKRSGTYTRDINKIKKTFELPIENAINAASTSIVETKQQHPFGIEDNNNINNIQIENITEALIPIIENDKVHDGNVMEVNIDDESFREKLRSWSVDCNVSHVSVNKLLDILKTTSLGHFVPSDVRTLLGTCKQIENIYVIGPDKLYWHNGLRNTLEKYFQHIDKCIDISLNINVDGLPLFKRSSDEFWPILANIYNMPEFKVIVVGIYCGVGKPPCLESFLRQFIDELKDLLQNGIIINGFQINIRIRGFICDTPARAFIKGKISYSLFFL